MQSDSTDGQEALTQRVERLERVIRALAARAGADYELRHVLLDQVEKPATYDDAEGLLNNAEAADYCGIAASTWRAFRAKAGIKPARRDGRRPKYRRRDIDEALRRLSGC